LALAGLLLGCASDSLPDPRDAARAYAEAATLGDAARIHGLLSRNAQRRFGREGTRRLVADARSELAHDGNALLAPGTRVEGEATVLLADGGEAALSLEGDRFRIDAAATLPNAARTPAQALDGLRRALEHRSYAALLRVLSADTRGAVEGDVRSLVTALADPSSLDVRVSGDRAEVEVPGGHAVSLRREGGVWRVEDVR
jgi:hypothetical protein